MAVTLTEKAELRLRAFLTSSTKDADSKDTNKKGIRVSVKDGGCSGYQYAMDVANTPSKDDLVFQQGNVLIYVDAESVPLLEGVVIDFIDGVMDSGFKFVNPNATQTCGCGKSFQAGNCTPEGVPCDK
ncbi:MAG: iron-sulfur cluster assembly accessory protein [Scytonematopsis contorta HA4267-MV1]|jgi:iron-sulfur cluster assembly protein|nr:iron-sulfur cluster assembly accessory protein [Scytonematopsis contorta HA4267-MV1]